jgi:hypothetical protein
MSDSTTQGGDISMDPRARAMLHELVTAGGHSRYVRIHVGRG